MEREGRQEMRSLPPFRTAPSGTTSVAYRFTLVKFMIFKRTELSVFSFLRLENELIVDSSGIL